MATNNQLTLHLAVSEHSQHYFHLSLHFFSLLLTSHFLPSHTPGTQQSPQLAQIDCSPETMFTDSIFYFSVFTDVNKIIKLNL